MGYGGMVADFSRTLALLRQEKRISQRQAASDLGVSQALLSHYENGVREPGLSFVVRAADYYGVSCDYMLGRTMSREGNSISPEEVPDVSEEKGNVLRGSALALLSKKLIVNSSALLLDVVAKSDSRTLTTEVSNYLFLAIYKACRFVYLMDSNQRDDAFAVPAIYFSELCDCEMKLCEHRLREFVAAEAAKKGGDARHPELSMETLQREYPALAPSMLSVLHNVSEKISKNFQKN